MKFLTLATMAFYATLSAACTETVVVVQDHYGECSLELQCPGTTICLDGVCTQPTEPVLACEQNEWMAEGSRWYCHCEGDNCIGTDIEPWSCPFDLLSDTSNEGCGIQCHDHFWLMKDMLLIDRLASPPTIIIDQGQGVVTCTQYVDLNPAQFITDGVSVLVDPNNPRVIKTTYFLTRPARIRTYLHYEGDTEWFLVSWSQFKQDQGGGAYGYFLPNTRVYWRLEAYNDEDEIVDSYENLILTPP